MKRSPIAPLVLLLTLGPLAGCRSAALAFASDAVAQSGTTYAKDDDPELVKAAVPFGLKTMEGLLDENPRHVGLLTALASGFTQFSYAFVLLPADLEDMDGKLDAARAGRERGRRLLLRAREYGLRGLEAKHEGMALGLREGRDLGRVLKEAEKEDVPLLYWTASAWALAISNGKGDMDLVAQLPTAVAMMDRALALNEAWGEGAIHEFFVVYDATRGVAEGGGPDKVRAHLVRVQELSKNKKLGPAVSYAEGVLVQQADRAGFMRTLDFVLKADPGAEPRFRLANILAQRRAKALRDHADDLFLD